MPKNLYEVPVGETEVTKFCGGNLTSPHETCVTVSSIPGADGFVLRDSKPEGAGKELRFTGAELDAFVVGMAQQRGLTL